MHRQPAQKIHIAGIKADLFPSLAEGGRFGVGIARVDLATGKGDLPGMML
jgi:hypothetical protein